MLLAVIASAVARIIEQCDLPVTSLPVLSKYYKSDCPYSIRIESMIDDIDSAMERSGVNTLLRYVDCNVCDCKAEKRTLVPSLYLTKNGEEIDKLVGSARMINYIDFIVKNFDMKKEQFENARKNIPDKVLKLKENDFDTPFDGPWIIFFFSDKDQAMRKNLKKLAEEYNDKVNFGEINSSRSEKLKNRINMHSAPTILAMFKGMSAGYDGDNDYTSLQRFASKLIDPTFKPLSYSEFKVEVAKLPTGEPLYLVLHSNLGLANTIFKKMAHDYKFKIKMFKSNDKLLFERASMWPKESTQEGGTSGEEDKVLLTFYRDGVFHKYPYSLDNYNNIVEWIFLSHFPHLSRITNSNFNSIFHGIKPTILLITRDDKFVKEFENIASNRSSGLPYSDILFSTLDVNEFPYFMTALLPKLSQPALVVYDPIKRIFFFKKTKLELATITETVQLTLKEYEDNKLPQYPPTNSSKLQVAILICGVVGLCAGLRRLLRKSVKGD